MDCVSYPLEKTIASHISQYLDFSLAYTIGKRNSLKPVKVSVYAVLAMLSIKVFQFTVNNEEALENKFFIMYMKYPQDNSSEKPTTCKFSEIGDLLSRLSYNNVERKQYAIGCVQPACCLSMSPS